MRAYISSPVDAITLLRGLEEKAGAMADYSARLNGHTNSTQGMVLRVIKTVDGGPPTCVTILRCNTRTVVASLENEEELGTATRKHCLAALLIPLVTEYVKTHDSPFTTEDRVQIAFGEANGNRRKGEKCILFAGTAATNSLF